jgi:hypothetical protein
VAFGETPAEDKTEGAKPEGGATTSPMPDGTPAQGQ